MKKLQLLHDKQKNPKSYLSKNPIDQSKINANDSYVVNKSSKTFTPEQLNVLERGLKFMVTVQSIDLIDAITIVETSFYSAPKLLKQATIAEISKFVQKWEKPKKKNLTADEMKALKELKRMEDIAIVPAHKGGKTVILDTSNYTYQIEKKLQNKIVYKEVNDPTENIKKAISKLTPKLLEQEKINLVQQKNLNEIDNLQTIRGQPKLHKQDESIRIITCSRNTITHPLSHFVFSIIKELRSTIGNNLINTKKFVETMLTLKLNPGEHLASLDVCDMFNNIPLSKAIDIVIDRLDMSNNFKNSKFTKTDIRNMFRTTLSNGYFQFNKKFYKQKSGLPMGNCLSPLLSDLYTDNYINEHLTEINKPLKFWRYFDDTIIITKFNKQQLDSYVDELNKIPDKIRFTTEFETDKKKTQFPRYNDVKKWEKKSKLEVK